jgi:hypothetical protein
LLFAFSFALSFFFFFLLFLFCSLYPLSLFCCLFLLSQRNRWRFLASPPHQRQKKEKQRKTKGTKRWPMCLQAGKMRWLGFKSEFPQEQKKKETTRKEGELFRAPAVTRRRAKKTQPTLQRALSSTDLTQRTTQTQTQTLTKSGSFAFSTRATPRERRPSKKKKKSSAGKKSAHTRNRSQGPTLFCKTSRPPDYCLMRLSLSYTAFCQLCTAQCGIAEGRWRFAGAYVLSSSESRRLSRADLWAGK